MNISLFLLLLFGVLMLDGPVNAGKWCRNPVPGVTQMISGVDITEINLFESNLKNNGFRDSVIDLTCDQNRKWKTPSIPDMIFDVPDQVKHIDNVPFREQKTETFLIQNREHLENKFNKQVTKSKNSPDYALAKNFYQDAASLINSSTYFAQVSAASQLKGS